MAGISSIWVPAITLLSLCFPYEWQLHCYSLLWPSTQWRELIGGRASFDLQCKQLCGPPWQGRHGGTSLRQLVILLSHGPEHSFFFGPILRPQSMKWCQLCSGPVFLSHSTLLISPQKCPDFCFLGDFRPCEVDIKINYPYHLLRFKMVPAQRWLLPSKLLSGQFSWFSAFITSAKSFQQQPYCDLTPCLLSIIRVPAGAPVSILQATFRFLSTILHFSPKSSNTILSN